MSKKSNEDNTFNWIKTYIEILPGISIVIYVLAIIYNIAFFSVFNVNIVHYISFVEMLLSVIDIIVLIVFLLSFLIWFFVMGVRAIIATRNICVSFYKARMQDIKQDISAIMSSRKFPNKYIKPFIKYLKDNCIVRFVLNLLKKNKKTKESINKTTEIVVEEFEINDEYNVGFSLDVFVTTLVLLFLSYVCFWGLCSKFDGLIAASLALTIAVSLFCIFMMSNFDFTNPFALFNPRPKKIVFIKYGPIEKLEIALLFYVYAIAIFYSSGIDSGKYYKEHDTAKFEIKTSDTIFNDSTYRYINQLNEKVFLLEKASNNIVILSDEGIEYIKINFVDDKNNSTIARIVNYL